MSIPDRDAAAVPVDRAFLTSHPASALALVGGAGLFPYGPGTVGALAGIPLGLALQPLTVPVAGLLVVLLFGLGIWACGTAAERAGVHDHPAIVFDEAWAMAAVLAFSPAGLWPAVVAFAAFRLFDIAKPWPINLIDRRVGSGIGIMLDDAAAAVLALAAVGLLARYGWF